MRADIVRRLRGRLGRPFEWGEMMDEAAYEIEQLRAALVQCAAGYSSPPCAVGEGMAYLSAEFMRRMIVAEKALGRVAPTSDDR